MPQRLRLSRRKGVMLPFTARSVARCAHFMPGNGYGNPWKVANPGVVTLVRRSVTLPQRLDAIDAVQLHESWLRGGSLWTWHLALTPEEEKHLLDVAFMLIRRAMTELQGRDLACWCALDEPCHADTWLRIANG